MMFFIDRSDAGKKLSEKLLPYAYQKDALILALPRGGMPVAYEIAKVLHLPLDVLIVRKLGVPFNEELAMGAIAMGETTIIDREIVNNLRISDDDIEKVIEKETRELNRRNDLYRKGRAFPDVKGKTIILVDDGIATGSTMKAALKALKIHNPYKITVAVPVGPESVYDDFKGLADEVICLDSPEYFYAVGQAYREFPQTSDKEVRQLLKQAIRS